MIRASTLVTLLVPTTAAEAAHGISIEPSAIGFGGGPGTELGGGLPGEVQLAFFQVQNPGTSRLIVTDMAITGPDAGIMAFDGANDPFCGSGQDCRRTFSLAPGGQRAFVLTCTPTHPGVFSASLAVASNAAHGATTAAISCVGNHPPVIAISPSSLDFGIVHICDFGDSCDPNCGHPVTRTVTITNTAPAPSELDFFLTPTIPSSPQGDFTVTPTDQATESNPFALAAGQSFSIEITYHPRDLGASVPGPLTLVSLFPGQAPITIPFHAEGGEGNLVLDTPSVLGSATFGQTLVSSISAHNDGTSCLDITRLDLEGECTVTSLSLPIVLQPGEAFTVPVTCTPTLGTFGFAELEVDFPFEGGDALFQNFQCVPTGGALAADEPDVLFTDPVEVGTSATQQIDLTNFGNDPTQLVSITSTNPLFTATLDTSSLPLTLGPDESVVVDITFAPTEAASASGTIAFDVSTGLGTTVSVAGDGVMVDGRATPRARLSATAAAIAPQAPGGCNTTGNAGLPLILGALWLVTRRRAATSARRSSRHR